MFILSMWHSGATSLCVLPRGSEFVCARCWEHVNGLQHGPVFDPSSLMHIIIESGHFRSGAKLLLVLDALGLYLAWKLSIIK